MTQSAVSVTLVNYNGGAAIERCIEALHCQTLASHIVVVDNASQDSSLRSIASRFPTVQLVPLRRNVGFARAANIGARRNTAASTLVMLNPDTIPQPDFLEALVSPLTDDERLGAVAGTLVFSTAPHLVASAGIDVHRNGVALDAFLGQRLSALDGIAPVFGASGGAAAYRRSAFFDAGGFCEPFFLYLEDVDLAWRLRLRGWDVVSTSHAVASHEYSASAGEGSPLKRRLLARNRAWTLARCLPDHLWVRDWCSIVGFDVAAFGYAALHHDGAAMRGRCEAVSGLVMRLMERTRIQSAASIGWQEIDRWIKPAIMPAQLLKMRQFTLRHAARQHD